MKTAKLYSSPKPEIVVSFVVTGPYNAPLCRAEKKAAADVSRAITLQKQRISYLLNVGLGGQKYPFTSWFGGRRKAGRTGH